MSQYDMRSQIYYQCVAAANAPLALVKQGLQEYVYAYAINPDKLVLGVPWYGYKYDCLNNATSIASTCDIQPVIYCVHLPGWTKKELTLARGFADTDTVLWRAMQ